MHNACNGRMLSSQTEHIRLVFYFGGLTCTLCIHSGYTYMLLLWSKLKRKSVLFDAPPHSTKSDHTTGVIMRKTHSYQ